ncbi:YesN/AraC family two-component response regulator [Paenibacillus rhizosphaerae]|uniref:YesN/AraC family two-component response regulator n=2 Tax=Paenibacillus rhizosphaerae TaxID=297318 RepID=A0A839U1A7_9BACL|nr:YesN/AraC family two-component response regulator [Paenibacillus rhizosphaerae]
MEMGIGKRGWMHGLRRKSFYIKLVMTTALIAIVPSLLSDVFALVKVSSTFRQETGANKLQYLDQTVNALEMILNRIKENSNLLAMNPSIQEFEQFPNSRYYEDAQGPFKQKDLPALYSYLEAKERMLLTINSFRLTNPFVDSVYFYDGGKNLILTSENEGSNRQFAKDDFYDQGWYGTLDRMKLTADFMDTRAAKQYSGEKDLLTIVYRTNNDKNAFIVNLNASMIYNDILNKLNRNDDIYVVSSTGSVLFHSASSSLHRPIGQIVPGSAEIVGTSGSYQTEMGGGDKLVSYSVSPLLGWTFINISDMEALSKGTSSIKQMIFLSALLLVLITLTLVYFSSRSLYRPISLLKEMIGSDPDKKSAPLDEIGSIGQYVRSALDERDYYKEKLGESLPFQRERFKLSLLRQHRMTLDEIAVNQAYLGIELDLEHLAVIVFQWNLPPGGGDEAEQSIAKDLLKLRFMEMAELWLESQPSGMAVEADKEVIAIVVNKSGMNRQDAFRLGQELIEYLEESLHIRVTAGIGRVCRTAFELPVAFEEALEALKYRILYGDGELISIEDVRIDSGSVYVYPKQLEEKLISQFKTARTGEALQTFDLIAKEVNASRGMLHYNQIQPLFMQLLTAIMNAYHELGADTGSVSGDGRNLYRELLELESMDQIRVWFHELIPVAAGRIERELNAKGHHHISRVIAMMELDYASDLSLNLAAERLNLNPAYISRLFKQITGQPFVDYLKQIRIEKSKELLKSGNMKIGDIGKRVGYSNSHYFIKVFKDSIGITPGEYKKLYG